MSEPPWMISVIKTTSLLVLETQALMNEMMLGCMMLLRMLSSSERRLRSSRMASEVTLGKLLKMNDIPGDLATRLLVIAPVDSLVSSLPNLFVKLA